MSAPNPNSNPNPTRSGYYLHGECPDINAGDNTLATINDLLRREAANQLQERALPGAVSIGLKDCLSYEIYVPPGVRDKYRAKLLNLVQAQTQRAAGGAGAAAGPGALEADRRLEEEARKVAEARSRSLLPPPLPHGAPRPRRACLNCSAQARSPPRGFASACRTANGTLGNLD